MTLRSNSEIKRRLPSLSRWAPSLIIGLMLSLCAPVVLADDDSRYLAMLDSADLYMKGARWSSAEDMIRGALRLRPALPTNYLLFSNLGVCLSAQGRYGDALEAFEIGLLRAPSDPRILLSRGKTYLAMRHDDDAEADFSAALAADSTLLEPRRLRAQLRLIARKYDEAASDFRAIMRLHPSEPWGPSGLADCLQAAGDHEGALRLYRDPLTLETEPERRGDIYVGIVGALIRLDRLYEADDAVREAIRKMPRCGELYMMRSVLHRRRFQNEDAEIDKKMAMEYGVEPQIFDAVIESFSR